MTLVKKTCIHVVISSIVFALVFLPSLFVTAFFSGCFSRCENVSLNSVRTGAVFGAVTGLVVYTLLFRLVVKAWPRLLMLSIGTVTYVFVVVGIAAYAARSAMTDIEAIVLVYVGIVAGGAVWVISLCWPYMSVAQAKEPS